jgi:drug/metabolite transporter (DMT)-like permease
MSKSQRDGALLTLLSAACFACLPIFAKALNEQGLIAIEIVWWRFILATPMIWGVTLIFPRPVKPLPRFRLLIMGVIFATAAFLAFEALRTIPASMFTVLVYTYPAIVAMISAAMGERLPLQGWLAVGLTLIGIIMTVPELFTIGFANANLGGALMSLFNAALVATYFILIGRLLRGHQPSIHSTAWYITGALFFLTLIAVPNGISLPPNLTAWALLGGLALVSTVLSTAALNIGIQKAGSSQAAILSTVEPVITLLLAMILLGEKMQLIQWLGGGLILLSVILLQVPLKLPVFKSKPAAETVQ